MPRGMCPFHTDDDVEGELLSDGSWTFACDRPGHPGPGPWQWLLVPEPAAASGLSGLAEELGLAQALPEAIRALGSGWFEYGLVERAYAEQHPDDFARMVERWGHTAIAKKKYTVSAYLAGCLGRLSAEGVIGYHPGRGTGRWSYNADISWWSALPASSWEGRTAWVDVVQDTDAASQHADAACRAYVPGA